MADMRASRCVESKSSEASVGSEVPEPTREVDGDVVVEEVDSVEDAADKGGVDAVRHRLS